MNYGLHEKHAHAEQKIYKGRSITADKQSVLLSKITRVAGRQGNLIVDTYCFI